MVDNWFFINVLSARHKQIKKEKVSDDFHVINFEIPSKDEVERDYDTQKRLQSLGMENDALTKEKIVMTWHSRH